MNDRRYVAHSQAEAEAWDEVRRYEDEMAYFALRTSEESSAVRAEVDDDGEHGMSEWQRHNEADRMRGIG